MSQETLVYCVVFPVRRPGVKVVLTQQDVAVPEVPSLFFVFFLLLYSALAGVNPAGSELCFGARCLCLRIFVRVELDPPTTHAWTVGCQRDCVTLIS